MSNAFDTEAIRADLRNRSVRSGIVNLSSQATQILIGIGGTMVLARILTPADFGLYAMTGTLIAFIGSFHSFGIPMAAVHRETLDHGEYSALFWVYQRINLLITLFMLAMAPVLSWFYGRPELTDITIVMAGGIFLLGLAVHQEALLKRQMRFGVLTAIDILATVLGLAGGVAAALSGAGYWALVIQFLAMCGGKTLGCWLVSHWRPSRVSASDTDTAEGLGKLLSYGADVTAGSVVRHISKNLDRVLVGYFSGAQSLGLYYHAQKWAFFPVSQTFRPLKSVVVTGLSRLQDSPERYRAYVRRVLRLVFSLTQPAIAFLFVEAPRVIELLLGPQWSDAVPFFRIFCLAAFASKFATITKWLYLSTGRTRRQLRWELISTPVMVAAVVSGMAWGATGIAVGFTAGTCLLVVPNMRFHLKGSQLRMRDLLVPIAAPTAAAALAIPLYAFVGPVVVVDAHPLVTLPIGVAVFGAIYLTLWVLLPGGSAAAREVLDLRDALPKIRGRSASASSVEGH